MHLLDLQAIGLMIHDTGTRQSLDFVLMPNPASNYLAIALGALFRPVARLLLRKEVAAKSVIEIFKTVLVDVAISDFGKNGKPASVSAVSRMTGLSRKEVSRLSARDVDAAGHNDFYGTGTADILAIWYRNENYLDQDGNPRALARGDGRGTFDELVRIATGRDLADKYLERLRKFDRIAVLEDGDIAIQRRDWHIGSDLPLLIGQALAPLANTIDKNWVTGAEDGLCQRTTYTVRIDPSKVDLFRRMVRSRIISFVEEIDDYLVGIEDVEPRPFYSKNGQELVRLGVGAYYFEIDKMDDRD